MKVDKSVINQMNRRTILNLIRNNSPIFKAELSRLSNLSIPTVMKITEDLMEKNLVVEAGKGVSSGGKPPQLLSFQGGAYKIVGVDINDYRIDTVLMDLQANIICRRTKDISSRDNGGAIVCSAVDLIAAILNDSGLPAEELLGVGMGITGIVDSNRGTVSYSSSFDWKDVDLLSPIRESFNLPVVLDNSTRAMAMGEKLIGIGREAENFVYIDFGRSIGSAIVTDGMLYYGSNEASGLLGHMAVERNGHPCRCGSSGCLDMYASPGAVQERAKRAVSQLGPGQTSQILDLVYGDIDRIDVYIVLEAAENGDSLAISIIRDAAEYVGMAVANLMNIVDPQLIILEGRMVRGENIFYKYFCREVKRRQGNLVPREFKLCYSSMGRHIGAIGAASFILNRFLEKGGERLSAG